LFPNKNRDRTTCESSSFSLFIPSTSNPFVVSFGHFLSIPLLEMVSQNLVAVLATLQVFGSFLSMITPWVTISDGTNTLNYFMITSVLATKFSTNFSNLVPGDGKIYQAGAIAVTFVLLEFVSSFFTLLMILQPKRQIALISGLISLACAIIAWCCYAGLVSPFLRSTTASSANLSAGFAFQIIFTVFQVALLFLIFTMTIEAKPEATTAQAGMVVVAPPVVISSLPPPPMVVAPPPVVVETAPQTAPAVPVSEVKVAEAV
jgi:hypothetical protein